LDWPGSESGAEVWDGLSRNLGAPVIDRLRIADGTAADSRAGPARRTPSRGSERGEEKSEREGETISQLVVGTGSLSALIVPLTPGNVARADPVEESGAPFEQNRC